MPATSAISSGGLPNSTSARCNPASTPKSPQPGHHHDLSFVWKSFMRNLGAATLDKGLHPFRFCHDLFGQEGRTVIFDDAVEGGRVLALFPQRLVYFVFDELPQLSLLVALYDEYVLRLRHVFA